MRSTSKRSLTFVAVMLCAFAACSSRAAYAAPDPCTLLTQAQVSAVLGGEVGTAMHVGATLCKWTVAGPAKIMLQLTMRPPVAFAAAKAPAGPNMTKAAVSGVGDDAVSGVAPILRRF